VHVARDAVFEEDKA
jgi:hypothetical protein